MAEDTVVVEAPPAPVPAAPPVVPPSAPPIAPPTPAPEWMANLPEELRADKTLGKYPDAAAAHKGHVELQKVYGAKTEGTVRLPPADAKIDSPEVVAYRTAAGIPLTVDGYKDVRIPEAGTGPGMSPEGVKAFTENVALPSGMTAVQVQQAVNFLAEHNAQQTGAWRQSMIDAQAPLRQQWGANFSREVGLAARATAQLEQEAGLSPDYFAFFRNTGFNESPDHIKLWAWVGRNLFEKGIIPGHVEGALTTDELTAKEAGLRAALAAGGLSEKDRAAKMTELENVMRAAHGTKEA